MSSNDAAQNLAADEKAVAAANGLGGGGILEATKSPAQEEYEDPEVDPTRSSASIRHHGESEGPPRDVELLRTTSGPPYTVFSKNKKRFIIGMAMMAGFFSPFSANIYFPALNVIAADLNVTNALVSLTLTTYMIFQGLAPTYVVINRRHLTTLTDAMLGSWAISRIRLVVDPHSSLALSFILLPV